MGKEKIASGSTITLPGPQISQGEKSPPVGGPTGDTETGTGMIGC